MIDPEADLSEIALEIIDAYMELINTEAESSSELSELLTRFEGNIKALLKEEDVLPALENMRGEILDLLDA